MGKHLDAAVEFGKSLANGATRPGHAFEQQCLRILRCTAQALANSPGGLRFRAGTQPWLDALTEKSEQVTFSVHHGR